NVEGIRWFVERIYPSIQAAVPGVRLYVVGNRPSADVQRLGAYNGVTVTGFVEDVRDYLAGASACIAPLQIARGIQNKILEAMAMGRPVIATRVAFEGIRAQPGRDLVVADGEAAFAAATVELLRDAGRAAQIGRNARLCVEQGYSWATSLRGLDETFAIRPTAHARLGMVGTA
ncbi:MAG: glycosyltransferase, partial [Steroidobacteraceae bacterium]